MHPRSPDSAESPSSRSPRGPSATHAAAPQAMHSSTPRPRPHSDRSAQATAPSGPAPVVRTPAPHAARMAACFASAPGHPASAAPVLPQPTDKAARGNRMAPLSRWAMAQHASSSASAALAALPLLAQVGFPDDLWADEQQHSGMAGVRYKDLRSVSVACPCGQSAGSGSGRARVQLRHGPQARHTPYGMLKARTACVRRVCRTAHGTGRTFMDWYSSASRMPATVNTPPMMAHEVVRNWYLCVWTGLQRHAHAHACQAHTHAPKSVRRVAASRPLSRPAGSAPASNAPDAHKPQHASRFTRSSTRGLCSWLG
jgi:hypothetical protein